MGDSQPNVIQYVTEWTASYEDTRAYFTQIPPESYIPTLKELIWSPDGVIGHRAMWILHLVSPEVALEEFLRIESGRLFADSERPTLYEFLSDYDDQRCRVLFRKALDEDPNPEVRVVAALGLGKVGVLEDIDQLLRAKEHDRTVIWSGHSVGGVAEDAVNLIRERLLPNG